MGEKFRQHLERELTQPLPLGEQPFPERCFLHRDALEQGINPGYPLGRDYPGMDDVLLIAVTERRTTDEIDRLAEVLAR